MLLFWLVFFFFVFGTLAYQNASRIVYAIGIGVYLVILSRFSGWNVVAHSFVWLIYLAVFIPLLITSVRRQFISKPIFALFKKIKPRMSDTEREALCADDTGWAEELFSGEPNWDKFDRLQLNVLSEREQAFLDGPVEELCAMINDWEISQSMQIPQPLWDFMKKHRFFSMIIPEKYDGLAFSAAAQAAILTKIASVSSAMASVVAVPNSLGPGELLLHYGTEDQKNYYLPRLAKGEEIPCFALTSPVAGSDAGSLTDHGIVCEAEFNGEKQLCIRLNWNKRYITLSPVATLLGLAFKMYDPDQLLGKTEYLGITCALIPVDTPNVVTGRRHYHVECAFPNGPTQGYDVLIPMSYIIGGQKMIGQGWRMLMECLAAGRGVSLPSTVAGGSAKILLGCTAYSRIRRQFNTAIGRFDGVQEALIKVIANTYIIQATRLFTSANIDQGIRPVVESAITKYNCTEYARVGLNAAMDLLGGKAICMGSSNFVAQSYFEMPISITVEGANILTRSMIIFGQGSIRCHPYVLEELFAADDDNKQRGLQKFDKALWSHVGFVISNNLRCLVRGLTNAYFVKAPKGPLKRYYQLVTRFSSVLAMVVDASMATLGGSLKRKENLSGRLADMVSLLYLTSSVLKYYEQGESGNKIEEELPLVKYICIKLLFDFQMTLHQFLQNFPNRWVANYVRFITLPLGRFLRAPSDRLMSEICTQMMEPNVVRARFKQYVAGINTEGMLSHHIENVFKEVVKTVPLQKRLVTAQRKGDIKGKDFDELVDSAIAAEILSESEAQQLKSMHEARMSLINVDDFANEDIVS